MSARKGMNLNQVKTNADRIRNMSDEELAEFLAYNAYCEECYVKKDDSCCYPDGTCKQKHLEWLQSKSRIGGNMSSSYWNEEDDENIVCPYCGEEYEPSYEDTYIGDDCVDCFTEDTNTYTCEKCGKKFTMYGYQAGWKYHTETINGEATEEEIEDLQE